MHKTLMKLGRAVVMTAVLTGAAQAAEFPDRAIRLVVGFGAGGASDVAARIIANAMSQDLGQQVVIDNRPGASTSIAGEIVAKSAPDGYTLFQAGNANAVNAITKPKPPFDVLTAFEPVGIAITTPSVLVAHPSAGIKTFKDFIAAAKAKPGELMYASSGVAAVSHIAGEVLADEEKIKITHVPYKGSAQAMTDLLAGRVQFMFAPISTALPFVREGKLVALASMSDQRDKDLPDTPTLEEAGAKRIDLSIWSGFVAPKGTPADRIAKLGDALQKALKNDDVRAQLAVHGIKPVVGAGPDVFMRRMKGDIDKLQQLVATTGMKLGSGE